MQVEYYNTMGSGKGYKGEIDGGSPPVIVVNSNNCPPCCYSEDYYIHSPTMLGLGIVQMVLGVGAVCFQIAATMNKAPVADVSPGVWCGFVFILAGAIGVGAGCRRAKGFAAAFCLLSIAAIFFTIPIFVVPGYGMFKAYEIRDTPDGKVYARKSPRSAVMAGMNAGLVIIGLLEVAFGLWSAIRAGISAFECCELPAREKKSNDIPLDGIQGGGVHVVSAGDDTPTYKTTLYHPVTIGVKVSSEEDVDEDKGMKSMTYDLYEESLKF